MGEEARERREEGGRGQAAIMGINDRGAGCPLQCIQMAGSVSAFCSWPRGFQYHRQVSLFKIEYKLFWFTTYACSVLFIIDRAVRRAKRFSFLFFVIRFIAKREAVVMWCGWYEACVAGGLRGGACGELMQCGRSLAFWAQQGLQMWSFLPSFLKLH